MAMMIDNSDRILVYFYKFICLKPFALERSSEKLTDKYRASKGYQIDSSVIQDRLLNGWTEAGILMELQKLRQAGVKANWLSEVLPKRPTVVDKEDVNLMIEGERYHHRLLRRVKLPVCDSDGTLIESAEILRRQTFTLSDLIQFYYEALSPKIQRSEVKRILKVILNGGTHLDDILHGIDLWKNDSDGPSGDDVYALSRIYCKKAREAREQLELLDNRKAN